jgi:patatin-like phospholipase/acyl hydrolase
MSRKFRILSIDGGGIRGLIPAVVMAELEARTGRRIADLFDLVAGTSTGGLLALGSVKASRELAASARRAYYSAAEMVALYEMEGPRIFYRQPWRMLSTVDGLLDEKYPSENIEAVLSEYFGEARLSESVTDVIVPAYDLETRESIFFKSRKARANANDDCLMWQAARATSAAPSYFEPVQVQAADLSYALVDGGVFANSPAMCAYAEARKHYPQAEDILLVSLGTGNLTRRIPFSDARNWGLAEWVAPLFNILFDGMADAVDYQLIQLLPNHAAGGRRYYRFQAHLAGASDAVDDASRTNIRALKLVAEDLIRANSAALDELCQQLIEN